MRLSLCSGVGPIDTEGNCSDIDPTPQKIVLITVMFNMYHTLKVGHRSVVHSAFLHNRFGTCCEIASNVARDYFSQYASFFILSSSGQDQLSNDWAFSSPSLLHNEIAAGVQRRGNTR